MKREDHLMDINRLKQLSGLSEETPGDTEAEEIDTEMFHMIDKLHEIAAILNEDFDRYGLSVKELSMVHSQLTRTAEFLSDKRKQL